MTDACPSSHPHRVPAPSLSPRASTARFALAVAALAALAVALSPPSHSLAQSERQPAAADSAQAAALVREHIAAAHRLLDYGSTKFAIRRLEKALTTTPESVPLLLEVARLERDETGGVQKAHLYAKRAVTLAPESVEAILLYGSTCAILGGAGVMSEEEPSVARGWELLEEASELAQKAAALDPTSAAPHRLLADVAWRRGYGHNATTEDGAKARERRLEESLVHIEHVLRAHPDDVDATVRAARVALDLGQASRSLALLEKISAAKSTYALAELKAEIALASSPPNIKAYLSGIERMRQSADTSDLQLAASIARMAADMPSNVGFELLDVFRKSSAIPSPGDRVRMLLPYLPSLDDTPRTRPVVPQFCYVAAHSIFRLAQSRPQEEQRAALRTEALGYLNGMGLTPEASAEFEREVPDITRLRAFLSLEHGLYEEAEAAFRRARDLIPSDVHVSVFALLTPEIAKGRVPVEMVWRFVEFREGTLTADQRIKSFQTLVAVAPDFALAHSFLGSLLFERGAHETARSHHLEALRVWPNHEESLLGLARCELQLRNWVQAHEAFLRLKEVRAGYGDSEVLASFAERAATGKLPGDALSLYLAALPQALDTTRRAELLSEAVRLAPEFVEALAELSSVRLETEEFKSADELARLALEHATTDLQRSLAEASLADVAAESGNLTVAASHYRRARTLEAKDAKRRLHLALHEATVQWLAGAHREVDDVLAKLTNAERFALFPADAEPGRLLTATEATSTTEHTANPAMRVGQRIDYRAVAMVSSEGGGSDAEEQQEFELSVECLGSPTTTGAWDLRLSFRAPESSDSGLDGAVLAIQVSPWFGLSSLPEELATLSKRANGLASLAIQAVVEAFAGGMGTSKVIEGLPWGRGRVKGMLHLPEGVEASVVRHQSDGLTVERLALADYRDPIDSRVTWKPRHRLEAQVLLAEDTRLPRRVDVRTERKTLLRDGEDVDVRRVGIRLESR